MSPADLAAAGAIGVAAGAVASIVGFGIGSLLTPFFLVRMGGRLAVAAVSLPHMLGTIVRLAMLRRAVDRRILLSFGLASAAGGLAGALLHSRIGDLGLTVVFALLLVFSGLTGLTGLA